jgi:hypothetical protein
MWNCPGIQEDEEMKIEGIRLQAAKMGIGKDLGAIEPQ